MRRPVQPGDQVTAFGPRAPRCVYTICSGDTLDKDELLLPLGQKAHDNNRWLLPNVEPFARSYKFTLGARLQSGALDLCLVLIEETLLRRKEAPLYRAKRPLDQALRLSFTVGA